MMPVSITLNKNIYENYLGGGWKIKYKEDYFDELYWIILKCSVLFADKKILVIDCGNSFDPYRLSNIIKRAALSRTTRGGIGSVNYRVAAQRILDNILISRMFTAHQLKTKLEELSSFSTAFSGKSRSIADSAANGETEEACTKPEDIILIIHNLDRLICDYYATEKDSIYAVKDGVIDDIFSFIKKVLSSVVITAENKYIYNALVPQKIFKR